jgi:hypothetical protein
VDRVTRIDYKAVLRIPAHEVWLQKRRKTLIIPIAKHFGARIIDSLTRLVILSRVSTHKTSRLILGARALCTHSLSRGWALSKTIKGFSVRVAPLLNQFSKRACSIGN